ncbi:hypothetical protein BKE30_14630 [Alkanindiges hydrocarboniclasticus]|uniref:Thioredoxin-like fold domain-containing protein n=1 Tax=Alkanindiges hydrocarboniclasticus TaxID=1907941 RepID=A0A1S8CQC8_9GAMM|nr:thioredoxin domain-containing protein [Alkanindiges hydrocarboniclasticus]ONG37364.1 hypothetical protein BKE30_14630 [Alkanindiges hydrocarboniclasticus]
MNLFGQFKKGSVAVFVALALNSVALESYAEAIDTENVYATVNVSSDQKLVRYFFSYTCPYCRKYDSSMSRWGKTLPKPMRFIRTPVITDNENSVTGAYGYYTVLQAMPTKLDAYQDTVYTNIQDRGLSADDLNTYLISAIQIGIPRDLFIRTWKLDSTRNLVNNASILGSKYNVRRTPTIGVGGKYSFDPEILNSGSLDLYTFSNVMVSKYIQERGSF